MMDRSVAFCVAGTYMQHPEEHLQSVLRSGEMTNHVSVSRDVKHCAIGIVNVSYHTFVRRTQDVGWDDKRRRVKFDIFDTKLVAPLLPS